MPIVARLTRLLPIIIGIVLAALALYVFVSIRYTPVKAKEVLIKVFTVFFGVTTIFFILATIYAALDSTRPEAVELMLTFLLPFAFGLALTLVFRAIFLHNHPAYKLRPVRTQTIKEPLWKRFIRWVLLQR